MPIDYKRLEELSTETASRLQEVNGKDLVLVLGRTGAGKSSLITYKVGILT